MDWIRFLKARCLEEWLAVVNILNIIIFTTWAKELSESNQAALFIILNPDRSSSVLLSFSALLLPYLLLNCLLPSLSERNNPDCRWSPPSCQQPVHEGKYIRKPVACKHKPPPPRRGLLCFGMHHSFWKDSGIKVLVTSQSFGSVFVWGWWWDFGSGCSQKPKFSPLCMLGLHDLQFWSVVFEKQLSILLNRIRQFWSGSAVTIAARIASSPIIRTGPAYRCSLCPAFSVLPGLQLQPSGLRPMCSSVPCWLLCLQCPFPRFPPGRALIFFQDSV